MNFLINLKCSELSFVQKVSPKKFQHVNQIKSEIQGSVTLRKRFFGRKMILETTFHFSGQRSCFRF